MEAPHAQMMGGGHLYMQTNEVRNCIIHYLRAPNGTIAEVERVFTGGAGLNLLDTLHASGALAPRRRGRAAADALAACAAGS